MQPADSQVSAQVAAFWGKTMMLRQLVLIVLAASTLAACSKKEEGVIQAQAGDPVISLSEGACKGSCPIYDMTLHGDGKYVLNGEKFVRQTGVSEGDLGPEAYQSAEAILAKAGFWTMKPVQTMDTMSSCHTDAPTVLVKWRDATGKEKLLTYYAGCESQEAHATRTMIFDLRQALRFEELVWSDAKFDYPQPPPR